MVVEYVSTLRDSGFPGSHVADNGCTANAIAMTGQAGAVVDLRSRDCRGYRFGLGRGFGNGLGRWCGGLLLLFWPCYLPQRPNSLGDGGLVLVGIRLTHAFGQVGHLEHEDENRQPKCNEGTDHQRRQVEEFMVLAQCTAPEVVSLRGHGCAPAVASDYITSVMRGHARIGRYRRRYFPDFFLGVWPNKLGVDSTGGRHGRYR